MSKELKKRVRPSKWWDMGTLKDGQGLYNSLLLDKNGFVAEFHGVDKPEPVIRIPGRKPRKGFMAVEEAEESRPIETIEFGFKEQIDNWFLYREI